MPNFTPVVRKFGVRLDMGEKEVEDNTSADSGVCEDDSPLERSYGSDDSGWDAWSYYSYMSTEFECGCEWCCRNEEEAWDTYYEAAKGLGPAHGGSPRYRTGRTERLDSSSCRRLGLFHTQPLLFKYLHTNHNGRPTQDEVETAHRFCDEHVGDDCIMSEMDWGHLAYSLDKRQRWQVLDRLETEILNMDTEGEGHDLTLGVREQSGSEIACVKRFAKSVHSTRGGKKRFALPNKRTYAQTNTLLQKFEQKRYSKHDWKPEFKRMTHNQRFRGIQRQQMLKFGYKETLKTILRTEAAERADNETVSNTKPEVIYDVVLPAETHLPKITKCPPRCYSRTRYSEFQMRPNKQGPRESAKSLATIASHLADYEDLQNDTSEAFSCLDHTSCECYVDDTQTTERPEVTLSDYVVTKSLNSGRRKRKVHRPHEKRYFYKTPKIEKISTRTNETEAVASTSFKHVDKKAKTKKHVEKTVEEEAEIRLPDYHLVTMRSEDLAPELLAEKLGDRYVEGGSLPRRFTVRLSDDTVVPAQVLFQVARTFNDVLLTDVLVRLHCDSHCLSFIPDLMALDDLVSVDDVVSAAAKHIPSRAKTKVNAEKRRLFKSHKVDMHHLNQALRNEVIIYVEEEAKKSLTRTSRKEKVSCGARVEMSVGDAVQCEICYQECGAVERGYGFGLTLLSECGHVFCNQCWCQHLTTCIRRRHALRCPAYRCSAEVDHTTLLSLVDDATYRRLQELSIELRIELSSQWQWCPVTRCGRVAYRHARSSQYASVECACGKVWCHSCQGEPHWPATCQQASKYAKNVEEVRTAMATHVDPVASVEIKRCPSCRYPIEKFHGCNQMYCVMCYKSFCWFCLRITSSIIHKCSFTKTETVFLLDVATPAQRFVEAALERHVRWLGQNAYIVKMIKTRLGETKKKYKGHLRRRALTIPEVQQALAATRVYNHVIEHVMVVRMNFPRRLLDRQCRWAVEGLMFVTDRLESMVVGACTVGTMTGDDRRVVPRIVAMGDRNLRLLKFHVTRQQARITGNTGQA